MVAPGAIVVDALESVTVAVLTPEMVCDTEIYP
jgi:hypothetical protein